ncbi:similar to An04g07800 [Aspergillus luchuensis IFO 4308]|nr:similar to An04g07800 [Aspergillus luchuensis IFO 4308]
MLLFMVISVVFAIVDMCAIRVENRLGYPPGMEPFWKLAFVFKCLSDTIILDDFRSALDRLRYHYHPDGVPPQEATHARCRSTNQLVDCVPEASINRPEPVCRPPDMV